MKVTLDLSEEMQSFHTWRDFVITDLLTKHFTYFHEDTRWIKYVFIETINNYKDGVKYVTELFNETLNIMRDDISHEHVLIGIMYCLKYVDYEKIKSVAPLFFKSALKIDNDDMQEILVMMYYDHKSLWKYTEGIDLLEAKRPFARKYLEHYFDLVKTAYNK